MYRCGFITLLDQPPLKLLPVLKHVYRILYAIVLNSNFGKKIIRKVNIRKAISLVLFSSIYEGLKIELVQNSFTKFFFKNRSWVSKYDGLLIGLVFIPFFFYSPLWSDFESSNLVKVDTKLTHVQRYTLVKCNLDFCVSSHCSRNNELNCCSLLVLQNAISYGRYFDLLMKLTTPIVRWNIITKARKYLQVLRICLL